MTPDDAATAVRRIKTAWEDGDSELAHHMEDELYVDALRHIAETADEASKRLAQVALAVRELTFPRWYG